MHDQINFVGKDIDDDPRDQKPEDFLARLAGDAKTIPRSR
jgi:hypothetical protein